MMELLAHIEESNAFVILCLVIINFFYGFKTFDIKHIDIYSLVHISKLILPLSGVFRKK